VAVPRCLNRTILECGYLDRDRACFAPEKRSGRRRVLALPWDHSWDQTHRSAPSCSGSARERRSVAKPLTQRLNGPSGAWRALSSHARGRWFEPSRAHVQNPSSERGFLLHGFGGVRARRRPFRHWCLLVPKPLLLDEVAKRLALVVAAPHHVRVDAERELVAGMGADDPQPSRDCARVARAAARSGIRWHLKPEPHPIQGPFSILIHAAASAIASPNPLTALLGAGRGFISGVAHLPGLAYAGGARMVAALLLWSVRGLRRAERGV
jgi:hypothetical protein